MGTDVDALFKLPLGEFTSARNALAARLKKAGQQTEAAEAKALAKPSVSAWVVNQLYWRHGYLFGRLIDAGERLRRAQTTQQTSSAARELVNARRDVVAALMTTAAEILHQAGYSDTRDVMRRVTSTLEALSAYGSLTGAPSPGRLTVDLEPPGFETLAGLVPRRDAIKPRATESPPSVRQQLGAKESKRGHEQQRLSAAAKSAVRETERELSVARKQSERAAASLKAAAAHAKRSEGQRAKLEKQLAAAAKEADAAQQSARVADAEAREASLGVESAERQLQLARSRLEQLASKQD
jgi:hypothetical protein